MKINYSQILNKNLINVLKDVLLDIITNGLKEGHHLYITFYTNNNKTIIPDWLKDQFPEEMTIVIQHEYWNLKVFENKFNISLSFNNIKADLSIPFKAIISFADPFANFGLKLKTKNRNQKNIIEKKPLKMKNNVIEFKKFKKLN